MVSVLEPIVEQVNQCNSSFGSLLFVDVFPIF